MDRRDRGDVGNRGSGALTHPIAPSVASRTASHRALQLAPALAVSVGLFAAAFLFVALASLRPPIGIAPSGSAPSGATDLTFSAYRALAGRPNLVPSILISFRIAAVSTALAVVFGLGLAVLLREAGARWRTALQASLPVPYLVAAIAVLWTLSPSGSLSRLLAAIGGLDSRAAFPVIVQDAWGIGSVIAYTWKATPFVAMIVLAALDGLDEQLEATARTLGVGALLRSRLIVWPHVRPSLFIAAALVFAFTFGAYEVPLVLGATFPPALPLLAHRLYAQPDIALRPQAFALALAVTAIGLGALALGYRGVLAAVDQDGRRR